MESPFILEGPEEIIREGESRTPAIRWPQFSSVSSAGSEAYVNGSTDSASILSGSTVTSGNIITAPTVTIPAGYGGLSVVLEVGVTAGGDTYKTGIVYRVLKPGAEN